MYANTMSIDQLNHQEIHAWLKLALAGKQALPRLTADESPHLGIMRLEKSQKSPTRISLGEACIELLGEFCQAGQGDADYVEELLFLASMQKAPQIMPMLLGLVKRFSTLPNLALATRHTILSVLVDGSPPQSIAFWREVLQQDPVNYAGMALAGALGVNPMQAVDMLPFVPNDESSGEYAALNLDLAWDALPKDERPLFVHTIDSNLKNCEAKFVGPLQEWVATKNQNCPANMGTNITNELLLLAIKIAIPGDCAPRTLNARMH